jgi:hypothetical protein
MQKLIKAITRSESAYKKYLSGKEYFKALRIYKANKLVYKHLLKLYLKNSAINDEIILEYIFHLEDWFEQFNDLKNKNNPNLQDIFIFYRFNDSPEFPSNFVNLLKKVK